MRPLMLAGLLVVIAGRMPSRNPWNMIWNATNNAAVPELLIPGYLFLLTRDLRHPWEALVGTRVGSHQTWWVAQTLADGVVAVVLTLVMTGLFCALAVVSHHWSWHWNAGSVLLVGRHVTPTWPP